MPCHPLRTLLVAATGAAALVLPASAAAALPAKLVAPGCPGAADCTDPQDRTPVRAGWSRATTISLTGNDPGSGIARMEWVLDDGSLQSGAYGVVVDLGDDGPHTLATRAVDGAGNSSEWLEQTIQLDTTAPSDATAAPPSAWSATTPVSLTFLGTDVAGGSGIDHLEWRIGTGSATSVPTGTVVPFAADGATSVQHRAVDVAGNASAWRTDTIRIDTAAPTDTSAGPAGWVRDSATLTLAGTDPLSGVDVVRYRVPGGPTQTATSGTLLPITTGGISTIETQVVDRVGNTSPWSPTTLRVDTADPVDTTGVPTGWQTSSPVTVTVGGTDTQAGVTAVEWMLDSPTVVHRTGSSATVNVASDGVHSLQTRVVDGAGRQTDWRPATLRIDTTAPTNNTTVPTGWSQGPVDVTLAGADGGSGVARIEWSVDGGAVTNGVVGTSVPVRGDGVHTLLTTVVDTAGLRTAATSTVRIDATAPVDTTVVPTATRYGLLGRLPLTATDVTSGVARMEWKVDGGATQSGPSGSLVDLGTAGNHTLTYRVVDRAGNATDWTPTATVRVDPLLNNDVDLPVDTTTPPSGWNTDASVEVPVTGTDATTALDLVQWRLDGGGVQSGTPGSVVRFNGDGVHRFDTRVRDLLGHLSAWTGRAVRIDSTVPTDTTPVPTGWQRATTLALTGTDATSGVDHLEWTVDNGTLQTGPSGTVTPALTEGVHEVEHRVVDVAGNASAYRRSTLRIDLTNPVDTTPAAPTGWQTSGWTVAPAGTDALSGLDAMEVEVDGTPVTARPVAITADGTHVLRTRARDAAGNRSAWRAQTVLVDRTAPVDTTPAAPEGWRTTPWTATPAADDGAGSGVASVEHRLGDGAPQTGDLTVAAEGVTTIATRATDVAGLVSEWRQQTVRVDSVAPAVGVACAPAAAPTGYLCRAAASDATSGVVALRRRVDGGDWQALPGADATFPVTAGTVEVEAVDVAGNVARRTSDALAARVVPKPTPTPEPVAVPDQSRSVTVARRGKGAKGALGSILVTRTGKQVAVDARPLALGAGRQRIVLALRSGQLHARRVRVVTLPKRGGYSPRMGVGLAGPARKVTATITVARRVGKRWVTVATATGVLKP